MDKRDKRPEHHAFRTSSGVMVVASTIKGGARIYFPVLASWERLRREHEAA